MILKDANTMIYRDLTPYLILYTLLRVYEQYNHLKNPQPLFPCINKFITTMGLPCAHRIEVSFI